MPTGITSTSTEIILENDWITYILSTSGQSKALSINASGINLVTSAPAKFAVCRTKQAGVTRYHESKQIEFTPSPNPDEGNLIVTFTGDIKILLTVKTYPAYILFQVLEVTQIAAGRELLELNFINLLLTGDDHSPAIGAIYSHDFVVTTTVLLPQIDAKSELINGRYESSVVYNAPEELTTAQAVLWGAPKERWMELMSDLEIRFNLPHPLVGHIWLKEHKKLKESYLFVDLSSDKVETIIDIAQQTGIEYILIKGHSWCKSAGSYPINPRNFPPILGLPEQSGLKSTIDRLHSTGLKVGLHAYTFAIDKDDSYVTPSPHPELAKEQPVRLLSAIAQSDTVFQIELSPTQFEAYQRYLASGEQDIIVENEIMRMRRIQHPIGMPPSSYQMTAERDTPVLMRSLHPASTTLYHLPERYNKYLPEFGSTLCDQISDRIAALVHEVGIDFVYLDSHQGMSRIQPFGWYATNYSTKAFYLRFPSHILLQHSTATENYQWHMISRGVSDDFAWIGVKPYLDNHKIDGYTPDYRKAFLAQELGWVGLLTSDSNDDAFASTTLDEIEMYLNRSLGFDLPIGFETTVENLEQNGLTGEICAMIEQYERLRKERCISGAMRMLLQQPGKEYHLFQDADGKRGFRERVYAQHIVQNAISEPLKVNNNFLEHKLDFKITALRTPRAFESDLNHVLGHMDNTSEFITTLGPDCVLRNVTAGSGYLRLTIKNNSKTNAGWVAFHKDLPAALDLSRHQAIGMHVIGDNQHEVVSVELSSSASGGAVNRQYQFDVDFVGAQYKELLIPNTNDLFKYPYGNNPSLSRTLKRSLIGFDYKEVNRVTIYIKNVPPNKTLTLDLGSIKALYQDELPLHFPSIQIGSNSLHLLTDLQPGQYLKNEGNAVIRYDRRNHPISKVPVSGSWPVMGTGVNKIWFRTEAGGPTYSNKAYMEVQMEGSPLYVGEYTIWFSPLEFLAPTNSHLILDKGNVGSGIRITSSQAGDLQWLLMGLNLPSGTTIRGVVLNYRCSTANSYISQVRLTSTKLPPTALVIHDDPTDLKSITASTYQSIVANRVTDGTITLELRLNYANTTDSIDLGAIGLLLNG